MKKSLSLVLFAASAALACSGSPKPAAPAASAKESAPAPTPTPAPGLTPTPAGTVRQRVDTAVVEDTPTYTIERYKKSEYIRVDDKHFRSPVVPLKIAFFKEDDEYFYVYNPKAVPEEEKAKQEAAQAALPPSPGAAAGAAPQALENHGMPPEDFEDILPARVAGDFRFEEVRPTGLPTRGMWRHSFQIADMNGDGIPDIVAPPARLGDNVLHIWLGDGKGQFTAQKLTFLDQGKPARLSIGYGGVAVGDIDGDGRLDVVTASHSGGLTALFGEGDGTYSIVRKGLPARDFSSQAIALVDLNGDGKLDIVASEDKYESTGPKWDPHQLRVYLYEGARGWKHAPDALLDGAYSNAVTTFDYNGDGRQDVLTGSQAYGAVQLVWKNDGNGKFSTGFFPEIEIYGYHFAVATGTFGKERVPAFADVFTRATNAPVRLNAEGITVYSYKEGSWTRHRVWRKKEGKSLLYAVAMGDVNGDGLDDIVFGDSTDNVYVLRIFLQQPDGSFREADEKQEPHLDSAAQCIRLADLDRDGRLDIVVSKTYYSGRTQDPGGWSVFLNRK